MYIIVMICILKILSSGYFCLDYQMELARIKMIEEENLRLTQAVDKTEHGNVLVFFFNLNNKFMKNLVRKTIN